MLRQKFPRLKIIEVSENALDRGLALKYFDIGSANKVSIYSDQYITTYKWGQNIDKFIKQIPRDSIEQPLVNVPIEYTFKKEKNNMDNSNIPWVRLFKDIDLTKKLKYYMPENIREEIEFFGYEYKYHQIVTFNGLNYMIKGYKTLTFLELLESKEFKQIYDETSDPIILKKVPEDSFFEGVEEYKTEAIYINLRDINISYYDLEGKYHTFGTYKHIIKRFKTLAPYIDQRNIEITKGPCPEGIIRVILDADEYSKINLLTLNIGDCLEILCGLHYLQSKNQEIENKLQDLIQKEHDLYQALYPHRKIINYLHNLGIKIVFNF